MAGFRGGFSARSSRRQRKTAAQQLRLWEADSFDQLLQGLDAYRGIVASGGIGFAIGLLGEQVWNEPLDLASSELGYLSIYGIGRPVIRLNTPGVAAIEVGQVEGVEFSNLTLVTLEGVSAPSQVFDLQGSIRTTLEDLYDASEAATFVGASSEADELVVERCRSSGAVTGPFDKCSFIGNRRLGAVTITGGSDNHLLNNYLAGAPDDSASGGNNIADGNTGGVSYAAWTGTGSVAGDNT